MYSLLNHMAGYVLQNGPTDFVTLWNSWVEQVPVRDKDIPFLMAVMQALAEMDQEVLKEVLCHV